MKRRFLALALALVMVVGLLPVLPVLTVSAVDEVDNRLDLSPATLNTYDKDITDYYVASSDATPVQFAVTDNTATLSGSMERLQANYTSLNYRDVFTDAPNVDEHVTQTIKIDVMPIFDGANYQAVNYASGYFNVLTRNYCAATATPLQTGKTAADCHDSIMYSIYCVDAEGTLAMQLYYMGFNDSGAVAYKAIPVPNFAEELGVAFTLTTVWHADNKVTFICDGEELGTFDNATAAVRAQVDRREYFSIGYNGYGTKTNGSNPVNLTVSDVKIAHGHTAAADDGDCTTEVTCSDCGAVITPAKIAHNFDRKVPAEDYKVADADGAYYLSCACGTSSAGTEQAATFTVLDLSPAKLATTYTKESPNYYKVSDELAEFKVTEKYTATLTGSMERSNTNTAVLYFTGVFPSTSNLDEHVTQTVTITDMPIFSNPQHMLASTAAGYYTLLTRNYGNPTETTVGSGAMGMDYLMYTIYRKNSEGDLALRVVRPGGTATDVPLFAEELGEEFTLTTVWNADNTVSFYCDGEALGTFDNVTYYGRDTASLGKMLSIGYGSYPDSNGASNVDLTVSNVIISHGHTAAADDGDCTTAINCTDCGTEITAAQENHTPGTDDDNCATDVLCGNSGCTYVFEEGHALTHYDRVAPTNTEDGKKEYWYCAADNRFFLNADGTSEVEESELTIPKLIQIVDGEKAEVSTESVNNAINAGGENVALEVPTSKVELPADALDAVDGVDKDLVISVKDGVKVTVNPDALTKINEDSNDNALSIEVKAGVSLNDGQTAAMEGYGTVKYVVSATMFAGANAITDFGTGTVTIEIPFEMDEGTTALDYKLYYVPTEGEPQKVTTAVFANGKMTAVLNHFSEYAIVSSVTEPVEGNATITVNGGSSVATVTGTYVEGANAGDVFSVDVTWGNLSFNYMAANSWDPNTHTNTGGGWVTDVTGSVTVVNHSNIDVTVTVTKVDEGGEKNLGVAFLAEDGLELTVDSLSDKLDAGTTENTGDKADKFEVQFVPKGTLAENDENVKLATITVRIEKYVEEAQN